MNCKRWNRQLLYLLGFWLLLSFCISSSRKNNPASRAGQQKHRPANKVPSPKNVPDQPGVLVFITMSIAHDPGLGNRIIRVQDLVKTPGSLKIKPENFSPSGPYLRCILSNNQIPVDSLLLEHPLYKNVESVGGQHQFSRQAVKLDQAEFFIRFQKGSATHMKIVEKLPDTLPKELILINF